jgi:hypothetical protein
MTDSAGVVSFARDVLGLELWPGQAAILERYERERISELVLALGRRSGKGTMAAVLALHHALTLDLSAYLRPGEYRYVLVVATAADQSRIILETVRQLVEQAPSLRALLLGETSDELTFANRVKVRALPCSARSSRGLPASMVIMDEAAHFLTDTEGYQAAKRVYGALTPSVAQFGEYGRVLLLSTPLWPSGLFHDKYRQAVSRRYEGMLAVRASTAEMNPTIAPAWLERQRVLDPDLYSVEYEAEFSQAVTAYLSADAVDACVTADVSERSARAELSYTIAIDPAYTSDRFGLVGVCDLGDGLAVDLVRTWKGTRAAPVDHEAALDDVAVLARQYRAVVTTDQFCSEPVRQGLAKRGVTVDYQPWTNDSKRQAFASLKSAVNVGELDLLDHDQLRLELVSLETRSTPGGRPRIAARPPVHDDLACCLAAAVHALRSRAPFDAEAVRRAITASVPPLWTAEAA